MANKNNALINYVLRDTGIYNLLKQNLDTTHVVDRLLHKLTPEVEATIRAGSTRYERNHCLINALCTKDDECLFELVKIIRGTKSQEFLVNALEQRIEEYRTEFSAQNGSTQPAAVTSMTTTDSSFLDPEPKLILDDSHIHEIAMIAIGIAGMNQTFELLIEPLLVTSKDSARKGQIAELLKKHKTYRAVKLALSTYKSVEADNATVDAFIKILDTVPAASEFARQVTGMKTSFYFLIKVIESSMSN